MDGALHEEDRCVENEDEILFIEDDSNENNDSIEVWKILIADDEEEVHNVTKLILRDFSFQGRILVFFDAYTEREARAITMENPDVALVLLDVVMEDDDSGLKYVEFVRNQIQNTMMRIILRTGQPGQAPEDKVIINYDINDYKEKTELTSKTLIRSIITALRSYSDLLILDNNKNGLEKIISSSAMIFKNQPLKDFSASILSQLISVLNMENKISNGNAFGISAFKQTSSFVISSAVGNLSNGVNMKIQEVLRADDLRFLRRASPKNKFVFENNRFAVYFESDYGPAHIFFTKNYKPLNKWDVYLAEVLCSNIHIAIDNIYLGKEIENTQREMIFTLGEMVETRSKETGNHVKRVSEYSKILASNLGFSEEESEIIRLAAPMHDVGKLVVPDSILNKPGKLTTEEFEIIKTHSSAGYDMLKYSNGVIMKAAAIIAHQHHEKYNGAGYPRGLKGEEINIYGRLTALADVFDALGSDRVYKKAWQMDKILDLIEQEKGQHFDPCVVDIFFEHLDEFLAVRDQYTDTAMEVPILSTTV